MGNARRPGVCLVPPFGRGRPGGGRISRPCAIRSPPSSDHRGMPYRSRDRSGEQLLALHDRHGAAEPLGPVVLLPWAGIEPGHRGAPPGLALQQAGLRAGLICGGWRGGTGPRHLRPPRKQRLQLPGARRQLWQASGLFGVGFLGARLAQRCYWASTPQSGWMVGGDQQPARSGGLLRIDRRAQTALRTLAGAAARQGPGGSHGITPRAAGLPDVGTSETSGRPDQRAALGLASARLYATGQVALPQLWVGSGGPACPLFSEDENRTGPLPWILVRLRLGRPNGADFEGQAPHEGADRVNEARGTTGISHACRTPSCRSARCISVEEESAGKRAGIESKQGTTGANGITPRRGAATTCSARFARSASASRPVQVPGPDSAGSPRGTDAQAVAFVAQQTPAGRDWSSRPSSRTGPSAAPARARPRDHGQSGFGWMAQSNSDGQRFRQVQGNVKVSVF